MKTMAFIQARIGSTRLRGKVLLKIKNRTVIEIFLKRLSKSKLLNKIVVLIPNSKENDFLDFKVNSYGFKTFRGSEYNVLDRFYKASLKFKPQNIVRVTSDNPLVYYKIVDKVISLFKKKKIDYLSNNLFPSFPAGLDVEIFSQKALKIAWKFAKKKYDKEHVTSYLKQSASIKKFNLKNKINLSKVRMTLDTKRDFRKIKKIFEFYHPDIFFDTKKILKLKKILNL